MSTPSRPAPVHETTGAFIRKADIDPARLLELLQQWRRLQAGSSHNKCHSSRH
jgi:hypothetical protein